MQICSEFAAAAAETDFSARYYALCERFPLRSHLLACKSRSSEILQIANQVGPASKLAGPGHPYEIAMPEGVEKGDLMFRILGGTCIENHFTISFKSKQIQSTYAILALEVMNFLNINMPDPKYPRPQFYSLEELKEILTESYSLLYKLATLG